MIDKRLKILIGLMASAVKQEQESQDFCLLSKDDQTAIYNACKKHNVSNLIYFSVKDLSVDEGIKKSFENDYLNAVYKDATFDMELESIEKAFNERQIEYVVLKGMTLKKYYPNSAMRTMTDIDILISKSERARAKEVMEGLSYVCKTDTDDVSCFQKEPIFSVELHTALFSAEDNIPFYKEGVGLSETSKNSDTPYKKEMKISDFYTYCFLHLIKHINYGGAGIRSLADVFVLETKIEGVDKSYADGVFSSLNVKQAVDVIRSVAIKSLSGGDLSEDEEKVLNFFLNSGTYGKRDNYTIKNLETKGKTGYKLKRIFPPYRYMKDRYPILRKWAVLLPFYYIKRIFTGLKKDQTKKELALINGVDTKTKEKVIEVYKILGL